jgi:hypothetical protein
MGDGVIWLRTKYGKLVHLPLVGDEDFNTPDDPVKIPMSKVTVHGRALSGTQVVDVGGGKTVTIDYDPPGRTGACNQCGQCCTHCKHLEVTGTIGDPGATRCGIRAEILDRYKGCALAPETREPRMTKCSFRFEGE